MTYSASTNWNNEETYLNNLISSGSAGQKAWAENQLGVLNSAKQQYQAVNIDPSIGNFQNVFDMITGLSDKASARSLEYAKQNQDWSANQAMIANNFNAAEAAKNRDWQEYMSNTAHQREVADLKAAGLNPVLSAMNGNGAAVTSGASASASMPSGSAGQSQNPTTALVSLMGSMLSAQTAIQNQLVSARTQEAVAEKYTAMSYLTAQISAAASKYGADQGFKSHLQGIANQFKNEKWFRENYPSSTLGVLSSFFHDLFGYGDSGDSGKVYDFADSLDSWNDYLMKGYDKSHSGRGAR